MEMSDERAVIQAKAATLMVRVFALVRACPAGRVTTYGWIGKAVGYPRGARMIGWFMNEVPSISDVPAQRVINSKGELSGSWAFGQRGRMRSLLEAEGIVFSPDERVDLKRYGWDPSLDLSEEELQRIMSEAADVHVDISERLLHLLLNDKASPMRDAQNKE
jgi:methylated-DNA-protein-cysteine methyltransferase related protein